VLDLDAANLPASVDARLRARHGGSVRITASDTRSQRQNRRLAFDRLMAALARAAHEERARRPTKPSRSAVERRLADKRRLAARKSERRRRADED
jgi:ribosome-associated protein